MKRISIATLLLVSLFVIATGIAGAAPNTVLKVGANPMPSAPVLEFIKPLLAAEGIDLQIIEFSDYVLPNIALAEKDLDANFFQHVPYLTDFSANRRLDLTWTVGVYIAPIGLYSRKITSLDELPNRAQVAIPNDVTNAGRALLLLHEAGVIELRSGVGADATLFDITSNPKNIRFRELEAPLLPRALDDLDAAFINQTYALEAGLRPAQDAILLESGVGSPFANVIAVRTESVDDPRIAKLNEAITSEATREFILDFFEGSLVPAF